MSRRFPVIYWVAVGLGVIAASTQLLAGLLRGANAADSNAAAAVQFTLWIMFAFAVIVYVAYSIPARGRHTETMKLAAIFPNAQVVTTSMNEERRHALTTVGVVNRRLRLPMEVRAVLTPTSISLWRRDLRRPLVEISAKRITYQVGDHFTIAGKFRTLQARIDGDGTAVDLPLFPMYTRSFWPRILSREDLERIVERLNDLESAGDSP